MTSLPTDAPALQPAVRAAFVAAHGREPTVIVRAPGRVNLLGAHVDYSQGHVMPCAIDRAVVLAAAPRTDARWNLAAIDLDERATFDTAALPPPVPRREDREVHWFDYACAVAHVLRERGEPLLGMDVALASDVPIGAGVSSSAAVEVALLTAWQALAGAEGALAEPLAPLTGALLCQQAENDYLGVRSGIMDPFASLHGEADRVVLIDCRSLDHELVPLPPDVVLAVIDSGLRRRLVDSAFNDRRGECERAAAALATRLPGIQTLRDVSLDDLTQHIDVLSEVEQRRARHVVEECARVEAGAAALRAGDVTAFGAAIRESHESSRDLYDVSLPELDTLAEAAWSVPGCHGARLTGAGFGGCVVALLDATAVGALRENIARRYADEHGRQATLHVCHASRGAHVL